MNQKFSRKELERLECTEEEIKLVMDYQKKLPVIVDEDFSIDARILHSQLKVGKDFSTWIKGRINKYKFINDLDYKIHYDSNVPNSGDTDFTSFSSNQLARLGIKIEYSLTSNMAKELCLVENNEVGITSRKYFILMEDLVKRNKDWLGTRFAERKNYIPMCEALSDSIYRMCGRRGDDIDFKFEANRLNIIATGEKAQSIRLYFGVDNPSELTRDSLYLDYNEKINFLQEQNKLLLALDLPIEKRINMLIQFFDTKYPEAKPLRYNSNREYLLKARNDMLIELN